MQTDIETFEKTRTTQGIKVPSSLDLVDLEKVIHMARQRWLTDHPGMALSDDTIRVTGDEEHIVIHWTDEETN